jgi:hypothetical protein
MLLEFLFRIGFPELCSNYQGTKSKFDLKKKKNEWKLQDTDRASVQGCVSLASQAPPPCSLTGHTSKAPFYFHQRDNWEGLQAEERPSSLLLVFYQ